MSIRRIFLPIAILVALLSFYAHSANAQALIPSVSQINFGVVTENAPDSISLTLTNTLNRIVTVTRLRFYTTYGAPAFSSTASTFPFAIAANSTTTIWIKFSPRHNITHNSELIIENDGLRGVTRVDLIGQGRYSNAYYSSTENLAEEPLKSAMRTLLAVGYDTLGYVVARDSMFMQIDNKSRNGQGATQNTIESCYTGALAVGYVDRTDCQTTFSFNTEHTFPQGFFGSLEPMRSDLHHLYPCDDLSNNTRGNNPFGIVTNPTYSDGGSLSDGSFFEPRDSQKGRASRSLLYFVIRYQDYASFVQPQESLLRNWHFNFLPDQIERRRNDDIFSDQRNRNPFVDYPQFIDRIQSVATTSIAPVQSSLDFPEDTLVYGYVSAGNTATYQYVIVNNGNTVISLSNFSLTQTNIFSFTSGSSNVTLQPGESHIVRLLASPQSSSPVQALLGFNTSLTSKPFVLAPIYLNDSILTTINAPAGSMELSLFPNPTNNLLSLKGDFTVPVQVVITDVFGKTIYAVDHFNTSSDVLHLSSLPAGTYNVTVSGNGYSIRRLLIKR